jgi:hypothetical protein
MLISETSIIVDHFYMGPGKGCRQVMRCEPIGFTRDLDCHNIRRAMLDAYNEIQDIAFQLFRDGKYALHPTERHELASSIVDGDSSKLVGLMYDDDAFVRDIVYRELKRRGILDRNISRIGEFGNEHARAAAIDLLKSRLDSNHAP